MTAAKSPCAFPLTATAAPVYVECQGLPVPVLDMEELGCMVIVPVMVDIELVALDGMLDIEADAGPCVPLIEVSYGSLLV